MSAGLQKLLSLQIPGNRLSGSIPDDMSGKTPRIAMWFCERNRLSGPLPEALAGMTALHMLDMNHNRLRGSIPEALVFMTQMTEFSCGDNKLSGSLPASLGKLRNLNRVQMFVNELRGVLPQSLQSMKSLELLRLDHNHVSGSIPQAFGRLLRLTSLVMYHNSLSGSALDWAKGHSGFAGVLGRLQLLEASQNRLTGALPEVMSKMKHLEQLGLAHNQLRGTVPSGMRSMGSMEILAIHDNLIAGTLPRWLTSGGHDRCLLTNNQLVGSLPEGLVSRSLMILGCSGNAFEGGIPSHFLQASNRAPHLQFLGLSGASGSAPGRLEGPLPRSLARASQLFAFLAHDQRLEGNIPGMKATLHMLILHCNLLKALPDLRFATNDRDGPIILLHQNRLSCNVSRFGKTGAKLSLAAFGNHFWHPGKNFPRWIAPAERDGLFWVSSTEAHDLVLRLAASAFLFALVIEQKLGRTSWGALWRWQVASGSQGLLAQWTSYHLSHMLGRALWSVAFLAFLLGWDLYSCPRTLALASACLRRDRSVDIALIIFWGSFCLEARMELWLNPEGPEGGARGTKRDRARQLLTLCLLCGVWLLLTFVLALLAALDQAGKSVPGFFFAAGGGFVTTIISTCIGSIQTLIIKVLIPLLARKLFSGMHFLEDLTCLLVSVVIPAVVTIYLDGSCLEHWTNLWEQCKGKRGARFDHVLRCPNNNYKWCPSLDTPFNVQVLSQADICNPLRRGSASTCMQVVLLRSQDVWLSKWVTSSLVMQALRVLRGRPVRDPTKIIHQVALAVELAILAAGPLPLLVPVLVIAIASESMLGAVAWERGALQATTSRSMVGASWITTQILSMLAYLTLTRGDAVALLIVIVFAMQLASRL